MARGQKADSIAIGASGLCLLHCLAFPFLASVLPLFSGIAENELVHKSLVVVALLASGYALSRSKPGRDRIIFAILAIVGAGLLVASAYIEAFHDMERPLTIVGSLVLASAHIFRWQRHNSSQA